MTYEHECAMYVSVSVTSVKKVKKGPFLKFEMSLGCE